MGQVLRAEAPILIWYYIYAPSFSSDWYCGRWIAPGRSVDVDDGFSHGQQFLLDIHVSLMDHVICYPYPLTSCSIRNTVYTQLRYGFPNFFSIFISYGVLQWLFMPFSIFWIVWISFLPWLILFFRVNTRVTLLFTHVGICSQLPFLFR